MEVHKVCKAIIIKYRFHVNNMQIEKWPSRDFPGGPMVKILCCHFRGGGVCVVLTPGQGTMIPYAIQLSQKI